MPLRGSTDRPSAGKTQSHRQLVTAFGYLRSSAFGKYVPDKLIDRSGSTSTRDRIRRTIHLDREEARRDVMDSIEIFSSPKRRHGDASDVSPEEFEEQNVNWLQSVDESRGDSGYCLESCEPLHADFTR